MELAKSMMIILLTGILTDNFVLSKFLGICPFLGVSKTTSGSLGMGCAVTAVMVIATAVTWPLYYFFLVPMGLSYLNTILFIMIIAVLVQLIEMVLKKYIPALYKTLGVYLPLITTNCAVLGVTILNLDNGYNFLESIVCALGGGIGFMVAMLIFSGVRGRLERCNVPKAFAGMPITLVAASIVSLSFVGFGGLVDGIFGIA
ncbi:MAG: RnfABCDGE type electron transport complex subunit A [Oscillospiraceae bacterium]|nr:RnfABCDGE type electron transport complex subunit A [Oscillospiraceae bacterium]MCI7760353.1 RnfABCDGE type electron transport complex subunit A [[Eubacterium] saphenum]